VAEQGRNVGLPSKVYVEVMMREGRIGAVRIAGEAVPMLRGPPVMGGRPGHTSLGQTGPL
jgi:predicted PhzF superfamily epimerase YddE/YHI9